MLAGLDSHHLHADDLEASALERRDYFSDFASLERVRPNHHNGLLILARALNRLAWWPRDLPLLRLYIAVS